MNREQIIKGLIALGHQSKQWGPSQESYTSLANGWPASSGPCPLEADILAAYNTQVALESSTGYIETQKTAKATSGLGTVQNKTIFDALNELRRAIKLEIVLPTETKAQYADRLKQMWVANEP